MGGTALVSKQPNLRPYQLDCINAIMQGGKRQIVSLPTGSGKTVIFSELLTRLKKKALVLCPSIETVQQAYEKIRVAGLDVTLGIKGRRSSTVYVMTAQYALRNDVLQKLKEMAFEVLIVDEAHHFASDCFRNILDTLDCQIVGFTATPFRTDGKGLKEVFCELTYSIGIKQLIDMGYLVTPECTEIRLDVDLSRVATSGDDWEPYPLSLLVDQAPIRKQLIDCFLALNQRRPTLFFGVDINHCKRMCNDLNLHGVKAEVVTSRLAKATRKNIIDRFRRGDIEVLCNCGALLEGFDAPETSCLMIGRPTKSKLLFTQMVGRGLRTYPGKNDCVIFQYDDQGHNILTVNALDNGESSRETFERENNTPEANTIPHLDPRHWVIKRDILNGTVSWIRTRSKNLFLVFCFKDCWFVAWAKEKIIIHPYHQWSWSCAISCDVVDFEKALNVLGQPLKDDSTTGVVKGKYELLSSLQLEHLKNCEFVEDRVMPQEEIELDELDLWMNNFIIE